MGSREGSYLSLLLTFYSAYSSTSSTFTGFEPRFPEMGLLSYFINLLQLLPDLIEAFVMLVVAVEFASLINSSAFLPTIFFILIAETGRLE
jgi:hypothetical protein